MKDNIANQSRLLNSDYKYRVSSFEDIKFNTNMIPNIENDKIGRLKFIRDLNKL